ncbi:MAG: hypothetical protein R2710_30770 [Acidimicrobiales bacterium]
MKVFVVKIPQPGQTWPEGLRGTVEDSATGESQVFTTAEELVEVLTTKTKNAAEA